MSSKAWNELPGDYGGGCGAGTRAIEALYTGGCEARQIASLMEVLTGHLDQAADRVDPLRTSELAADVTRIANGLTARLSVELFDAETRCCANQAPPPTAA